MDVVKSIQQLESLRDEWNALAVRSGHALLRHEWFASHAAVNRGADLRIVVVRSGGQIAAIAPLVAVRIKGVERLELIGAGLFEPSGFLYESDAALAELVHAVLRIGLPVMLQRVPLDSAVGDVFRGISASRALTRTRVTEPSLAVTITKTWDTFAAALPGKLRYDIKRARTRASEFGPVAVETVSPAPAEVESLLDRLVTVESASWKQAAGSSMSAKPHLRAFFREYALRAAANGHLRMSFLTIGNDLAAGQMAVQVLDRLWVLKIGYDQRFARCSPGFLMTCEALRYAFDQGLASYEFLGSFESWEERWRPEARAYELIVSYPISAAGAMGACADLADVAWRRVQNGIQTTILGRNH